MKNFDELKNLVKRKEKRHLLPKDAVCYVCGQTKDEGRLRAYNEYVLCEKHYNQLEKYHSIVDSTPRQHKSTPKTCCICGKLKFGNINNKDYCRRHYIQMSRHGKILEKTIYDSNKYIDCGDYYECILVDKNCEEVGRTKIDKESYEILKDYKIYKRKQGDKFYAYYNQNGRKIAVHRFLKGISDEKYTIDKVVDHINGDSLDNRTCNLRICTQHENAMNNRTYGKIKGVSFIKNYNGTGIGRWVARIMHNFENIHIGYYDSKEEAILARIKEEKSRFNTFGPNKDLFYILDLPSPIDELKKILSEGV